MKSICNLPTDKYVENVRPASQEKSGPNEILQDDILGCSKPMHFRITLSKDWPISPLEQVFEEGRSGMAEMDVSHEQNVFAVFQILECVFGNIRLRYEYLAFSPWSKV